MLDTLASGATPLSLARFIEDVRAIAPITERSRRFEWLPDGRTALVFRAFEGGRAGDVAILGPRTQALFKSPIGLDRVVLLRFKPGWSAALFGVAASALADRVVPLEEIWGRPGQDLGLELLEARSLPEVLDHITRAVARRSGARRSQRRRASPVARRPCSKAAPIAWRTWRGSSASRLAICAAPSPRPSASVRRTSHAASA
jgi:hypothetical protein